MERNNMKTVALHNLGCKVNGYELDVMQQMLQENGYIVVPFDKKADIYIVNTCTVTNIADRKSRQMLHRAKKNNPESIVVAVGCYVQTGEEQVLADAAVDLAIGNNRKKEIVTILERFMAEREAERSKMNVIDINHTDEFEEMLLEKPAEHTRAYIKIQDGCNQFCTYCIIPYSRGRVRSRQEEDIIREIKAVVKNGIKEIVFTGIHIGSYGMDRGGSELLQLIRKVEQIEGLERIRIGSLEPRIITEEFVKAICQMDKICPHFHLSLQSGCERTLKDMNRKYTAKEYAQAVALLRAHFAHPAITTDVIVGFPGETETDFKESKAFCESIDFYEMHVFKYSKRQGTRAAQMDNQIAEAIKSERSDVLLELEERMSHAYRAYYIGREVEVLYEEAVTIEGEVYQLGHTKEYIKVAKKTQEDLSNQIIREIPEGFIKGDILSARIHDEVAKQYNME